MHAKQAEFAAADSTDWDAALACADADASAYSIAYSVTFSDADSDESPAASKLGAPPWRSSGSYARAHARPYASAADRYADSDVSSPEEEAVRWSDADAVALATWAKGAARQAEAEQKLAAAPTSISLKDLCISSLPSCALRALPGLTSLCISGNRFDDLDELGGQLSKLAALVDLDVSRCQLPRLPIFGSLMPQLTRLDASANCLSSSFGLAQFVGLRWLSLADNRLRCLEQVDALRSLEELDVSHNRLGPTPHAALRAAAACPQLRVLHVVGNPVSECAAHHVQLSEMIPSLHLVDGRLVQRTRTVGSLAVARPCGPGYGQLSRQRAIGAAIAARVSGPGYAQLTRSRSAQSLRAVTPARLSPPVVSRAGPPPSPPRAAVESQSVRRAASPATRAAGPAMCVDNLAARRAGSPAARRADSPAPRVASPAARAARPAMRSDSPAARQADSPAAGRVDSSAARADSPAARLVDSTAARAASTTASAVASAAEARGRPCDSRPCTPPLGVAAAQRGYAIGGGGTPQRPARGRGRAASCGRAVEPIWEQEAATKARRPPRAGGFGRIGSLLQVQAAQAEQPEPALAAKPPAMDSDLAMGLGELLEERRRVLARLAARLGKEDGSRSRCTPTSSPRPGRSTPRGSPPRGLARPTPRLATSWLESACASEEEEVISQLGKASASPLETSDAAALADSVRAAARLPERGATPWPKREGSISEGSLQALSASLREGLRRKEALLAQLRQL